MKKQGVLNWEIASLIAQMGHGDTICIGDAGLPIPSGVKRIDLAVTKGIPDFLSVLRVIVDELAVEEVVVAKELTQNQAYLQKLQELLPIIPITYIDHEEFKARLPQTKAVIRTGEFTPYANVILRSGVVF
ncbi:MAG: D-ribose pyranase [Firmicutes bacterium]|nr:D-ribose pyranase [Bacillota bacterium]